MSLNPEEEKQISNFSIANKVKFYKQGNYLVAKVRKNGRLFNISSGLRIPNGIGWEPETQTLLPINRDQFRWKEFERFQDKIFDMKRDLFPRMQLFRKNGDEKLIRRRKKSKPVKIRTVNQAIAHYKELTNKNASIIKCLEYNLSKYKGSKRLDDFEIQRFYQSMKAKPSSKNTYITVLGMVLRKVVGIEVNIERDKEIQRQPLTLSKEQIDQVEKDTGKHANIVRLLLYTGARYKELNLIFKEFLNNPKSDRVKYIMPKTLTERVVPLKDKIRNELLKTKYIPKYKTVWRYFNDRYGIKVHALRATFITQSYRRGNPAEIISKAAGHTSVNTTVNSYLKFEDEDIFAAFE